jgi:hypothetical protein
LSIFDTYPEYFDPEDESSKLFQNTGNTAHFHMLQYSHTGSTASNVDSSLLGRDAV